MSLPVVGAAYQLRYTVNGSGKIQVEAFYKPEKEKIPLMPKFGMRMRLPSFMDYVNGMVVVNLRTIRIGKRLL